MTRGSSGSPAVLEDRGRFPALRSDPGHEEREVRGHCPDRREFGRRGGPDDETDGPAGPPGRRPAGDAQMQRLRGRVDGRIGRDHEVLEFAGTGIGRAAQDVGEPVRAADERGHGLGTEIRIDGHGVRPKHIEQGGGLARGRAADVAALRVRHHQESARPRQPDPLEGGDPRGPEGLEEGEIRLDGRGVWSRGFGDQRREPLQAAKVAREPRRESLRIGVEPEAQDGPDRGRPSGQPVQVGRGHEAYGDGLALELELALGVALLGVALGVGAGVGAGRSLAGG